MIRYSPMSRTWWASVRYPLPRCQGRSPQLGWGSSTHRMLQPHVQCLMEQRLSQQAKPVLKRSQSTSVNKTMPVIKIYKRNTGQAVSSDCRNLVVRWTWIRWVVMVKVICQRRVLPIPTKVPLAVAILIKATLPKVGSIRSKLKTQIQWKQNPIRSSMSYLQQGGQAMKSLFLKLYQLQCQVLLPKQPYRMVAFLKRSRQHQNHYQNHRHINLWDQWRICQMVSWWTDTWRKPIILDQEMC